MADGIAVLGLGIFGREVAFSLARRGVSVLAVDTEEEFVDMVKDEVDQAFVLDTTSEEGLRQARIDEIPTVVCAIGGQHMENSIITTALLKSIGVGRIVARATGPLHERILRQVGADEIVNPELEMARRIALRLATPGFHELLAMPDGSCVAEVPVPRKFISKSPMELDIRRKYGLNVVGIQRVPEGGDDQEPTLLLNFRPDDPFLEGDRLVVVGREELVKKAALM